MWLVVCWLWQSTVRIHEVKKLHILWCYITLLVQLWWVPSTLAGRGWSQPTFLWSHLCTPRWILENTRRQHRQSQIRPLQKKSGLMVQKTVLSAHRTVAGNTPRPADAPRTGTFSSSFPRRTQSEGAGPCCCWPPVNGSVGGQMLKSQSIQFKHKGLFLVGNFCVRQPHHEISGPEAELVHQQQREVDHLLAILRAAAWGDTHTWTWITFHNNIPGSKHFTWCLLSILSWFITFCFQHYNVFPIMK